MPCMHLCFEHKVEFMCQLNFAEILTVHPWGNFRVTDTYSADWEIRWEWQQWLFQKFECPNWVICSVGILFCVSQDQYDSIDISDNEIVKLENFPYLKRLTTLLVNNNRIARISPSLGGELSFFFPLWFLNLWKTSPVLFSLATSDVGMTESLVESMLLSFQQHIWSPQLWVLLACAMNARLHTWISYQRFWQLLLRP